MLCCVAHVHFLLLRLVVGGVSVYAVKSNKSLISILHGVLSPPATRPEKKERNEEL